MLKKALLFGLILTGLIAVAASAPAVDCCGDPLPPCPECRPCPEC